MATFSQAPHRSCLSHDCHFAGCLLERRWFQWCQLYCQLQLYQRSPSSSRPSCFTLVSTPGSCQCTGAVEACAGMEANQASPRLAASVCETGRVPVPGYASCSFALAHTSHFAVAVRRSPETWGDSPHSELARHPYTLGTVIMTGPPEQDPGRPQEQSAYLLGL